MVKQLFIRDFKNYKSQSFQNLLKTSVGLATNQKSEQNIFFSALKNGMASFPGNPTKALAKTIGILKSNRLFDNSEIINIKEGLRQSGYFVPNYVITDDSRMQSRSMQLRNERETKNNNNTNINQTLAHRESNTRSDKPMQRNYESRLQNIAKLPNQPIAK